jgi:hypothetical protein
LEPKVHTTKRKRSDKYVVIRAAMKKALDRLKDVPVDIEPIFPLAKGS